jgi:hypothetical protein
MSALKLLMTYSEAADCELDAADPSTMLVEVPDEHGEVNTKFFGECTVADLRKALQRLRKPTSSKPLPDGTRARAGQCRAFWEAYFPEKTGVRVQVSNHKGKAVMSLKEIPLEQMEQLTALLGSTLQPARAPSVVQARG